MTLSNFDWTDKYSQKWFIMLPSGHEGPYSLDYLISQQSLGKLSVSTRIWAEGLAEALELRLAIHYSNQRPEPVQEEEDELPPPLPPLPDEDESEELELSPALNEEELEEESSEELPKKTPAKKALMMAAIGLVIVLGGVFQFIKTQEKFEIKRMPGMNPELHQKIQSDFKFDGWDKKIFFKEYIPTDLSHLWLVTASFQTCDVEATFTSVKDKLLSLTDEKISFRTKGVLSNHVVDFSQFDFQSGSKIVPGFYELDIKADNCAWDGIIPQLANFFSSPEKEYFARTKVVLYAKGAEAFSQVLDKLIRKKLEIEVKAQDQEDLFWQDLQQKLQTLLAITLQIEQLMVDFLEKEPAQFKKNRVQMEVLYTQKFGGFLTKFVVANEDYFKGLGKTELSNLYQKQSYESLIRLTAKKIGHDSMKLIEGFQSQKGNPSKVQIADYQKRVKKTYSDLKDELNIKIIKVTEDRAN